MHPSSRRETVHRPKLAVVGGLIHLLGLMIMLPCQAATFILPPLDQDLIGSLRTIRAQEEDTLSDIARAYGIGFQEIRLANPGVDSWLPGEGTEVLIPSRYVLPNAPRDGIVLNLAEMRLYYYPQHNAGEPPQVITYPVSIGRRDWSTPLGTTQVAKKVADPSWYPPESVRAEHEAEGDPLPESVPPGPNNPLGKYSLRLGISGYLIHGTNKPYGIGMRVTHGCVRLYPEDIELLFQQVPVGTPVHIVNQAYKIGWLAGLLFLEIHPVFTSDENAQQEVELQPVLDALATEAAQHRRYLVDWDKVEQMVKRPTGIPAVIARER